MPGVSNERQPKKNISIFLRALRRLAHLLRTSVTARLHHVHVCTVSTSKEVSFAGVASAAAAAGTAIAVAAARASTAAAAGRAAAAAAAGRAHDAAMGRDPNKIAHGVKNLLFVYTCMRGSTWYVEAYPKAESL